MALLLIPVSACSPEDRRPTAIGGPPAEILRHLTAAEHSGEAVYRREGCGRCHTLFETPPAAGPAALPGPIDDSMIGSRVGPDLGMEGHRRSDDWQHAHLYAPEIVVPGSRMTASRHLYHAKAAGAPEPSEDAVNLVAYLQSLGRARRDVWAEFRSHEPAIPAPQGAPRADRLRRGEGLYAKHCASCHGAGGDGRGPAAALFDFAPRDFTAGRFRFRSTADPRMPRDEDLFRAITLGTGTGSAMPGFYFLTAEDRWALVLRIKEFSPALRGSNLDRAAVPAPSPFPAAEGDVDPGAEGGAMYDRLGCASCHGPGGRGLTREEAGTPWIDADGAAVPRSGDLTHACNRRGGGSPQAFARALLYGVGSPMPSYADAIDHPLAAARALIRHLEPEQGAPPR